MPDRLIVDAEIGNMRTRHARSLWRKEMLVHDERESSIKLVRLYADIQEKWRNQLTAVRFSASGLPSSFFEALWLNCRNTETSSLHSPERPALDVVAKYGKIIRAIIRLIAICAVAIGSIGYGWTGDSVRDTIGALLASCLGLCPYVLLLTYAPYRSREARILRKLSIWTPAMLCVCLSLVVVVPMAGFSIVYSQYRFGVALFIIVLLLAMWCVGQSPNYGDWLSPGPATKYASMVRVMRIPMALIAVGLALSIALLLLLSESLATEVRLRGVTVALSSLLGYALSSVLASLTESSRSRRQNIEDLRYASAKVRESLFGPAAGSQTPRADLLELNRVLSRNMFGDGSFSPKFASYEIRYLLIGCAIRYTQTEDITMDDMPLVLRKPLGKQDRIWGWDEEGKTRGRHGAKTRSRRAFTEAEVNEMSQEERENLLKDFLSFCVELEA